MLVFEDTIKNGWIYRTFKSTVNPSLLHWHRDDTNRKIYIIKAGGWCFQLDNKLPVRLIDNQILLVPAGTWHRVLPGKTDLLLKFKSY
jgi:mannose-6-phosphate isomerase-like protein (cupin superfamily)